MEYATLGSTGLLVSKFCFGAMTFGDGRGFFKRISAFGRAGANQLVKTSIDGGINLLPIAHRSRRGTHNRRKHPLKKHLQSVDPIFHNYSCKKSENARPSGGRSRVQPSRMRSFSLPGNV
jgi:hypothetical protein